MPESEVNGPTQELLRANILDGHKRLLKSIFSGEVMNLSSEESDRLVETTKEVIDTLTKTERQTIVLSFGLEDGVLRTPGQVAEVRNVTVNAVYPVRAKALRKLGHPGRSRHFHRFLV